MAGIVHGLCYIQRFFIFRYALPLPHGVLYGPVFFRTAELQILPARSLRRMILSISLFVSRENQ